MRFGALVLTLNEARHIRACLESLAPAERIVVIDSGSADRTVEVAASFPRTRVVTRPFESFSDQRNHGLDNCFAPGEWVLHLDADERLTPELAAELAALDPGPDAVAYNAAPRTFLRGRAVLRASGYPVYQTRLTRAGSFRFEEVGHGQKAPLSLGALAGLRHPYDHHPFEKGPEEWRERHERYAEKEARRIAVSPRPGWSPALLADRIGRRVWLNHATAGIPGRGLLVWLYLMIVRRGVLDGPAGWEYCRLRREYERMVTARVRALRRTGPRPAMPAAP
jgi:glycosyltransferase involved in cell wall biosynthesis